MSLLRYIEEKSVVRDKILRAATPVGSEVPSVPPTSRYVDEYKRDLPKLINFTYDELLDLWRDFDVAYLERRTQGKPPSLSSLDALFASLVHYSLYLPLDEQAAIFHIKVPTLEDSIKRIRPILLETLKRRWNAANFRPVPLPASKTVTFPYVALLLDSTTIPTYRPKGRFEEAKAYYDGKNGIYGLKKEVAVMASEPHFALFMQKGQLGARHDYAILKETEASYESYTTKTKQEALALRPDQDKQWAILCDNGYQGPERDTPHIRRIFLQRSSHVLSQQMQNEELAKLRVPVECFFGRAKGLWPILHTTYRGDHSFFDADIDITLLLTNEHIKNGRGLFPDDQVFFAKAAVSQREAQEKRVAKRKAASEAFKQRKQARINPQNPSPSVVPPPPPQPQPWLPSLPLPTHS